METDAKSSKAKSYTNISKIYKEVKYVAGNIGVALLSFLNFISLIKFKIIAVLMMAFPIYFFEDGRLLVLGMFNSIEDKGLINIFILFSFIAATILWCTIALRLFFKK